MKYKIIPTPEFVKNLKTLKKRYKNIKNDILELSEQLSENPTIGTELGNNIYKIRVKNSDIQKGKSGGYRVITYCINQLQEVQLITIYSKSDKEDIPINELKKIISEIETGE
jgi:mRNA-degrading endonuclease RelE of RelBE toxin-antitoxin system